MMDALQTSTTQKDLLSSVRIRHLTLQDLPALEWDGEYSHFRRLYEDAYRRYRQGLAVLWVAELPGPGIVGQVFIQFTCDRPELANGRDRAYLYSFRVRAEYRGMGLGTRILDVVESDLQQRGFRFVSLNVAKDNWHARKLYERRGYRIVAHEPGIWSYLDENEQLREVNEPAWRMEKRLQPGV